MASYHTRWITLAAVFALAACDKPAPEKMVPDVGPEPDVTVARKKPNIVREEGPEPTPATPIATAGDLVVTVADFEESSRISLLFAPEGMTALAPEQLAIPHVHLTMSRSLLSQKLVAAELERRKIAPTQEQMDIWLREHPKLGKFGKLIGDDVALEKALEPLGLVPAQLYEVARAEVSSPLLADAMSAEITDEEIWSAYAFEHTTRTAAIIASGNVPGSEEIDEWMGDHPNEIDEHYKKNPSKYRTPRRVKLNVVKPVPGEKASNEKLKQASDLLLKGVQPATVAKELGMAHELGAQLVRGENPKAFRQDPGQGGWMASGARGAYAWKVVGFEPSKLLEMTRPLRREIAAELLRTTTVVDSVSERLMMASKALGRAKFEPEDQASVDALEKEIEAIEGLSFQITTFANNPRGPLPKHGLAEEVVIQGFQAKVGESVPPFLSRERAFVIRVLTSHTASRKEFDANLEANRKAFLEAIRPRMVAAWAERRLNEMGAKIDVKPLRIKYGVLQKN